MTILIEPRIVKYFVLIASNSNHKLIESNANGFINKKKHYNDKRQQN